MKELGHPAMFPEKLAERTLKLFSFKNDIVLDPFNGGNIELIFYNSFNQKPCYDYEIELSDAYISESQDPGDACPANGAIGAQLPFKVKNVTTNKYVVLKHNDNGIFNGNAPPWYQGDHPGADDCMWQPGELIYFEKDSVFVGIGDDLEFDAEKTYALNLTYSIDQLIDRNDLCNEFTSFSSTDNYAFGIILIEIVIKLLKNLTEKVD